jgi:hypothetical protein
LLQRPAATPIVRPQRVAPITQTAKDSACSNVVAGGDVKIVCSPEKEEK